ncbi:hypothetical protein BX070DRAFT_138557 [Coemansia spiralis]|nr:hypothetical protein BX070DRAFT_138557 [Coemansia spiralis]
MCAVLNKSHLALNYGCYPSTKTRLHAWLLLGSFQFLFLMCAILLHVLHAAAAIYYCSYIRAMCPRIPRYARALTDGHHCHIAFICYLSSHAFNMYHSIWAITMNCRCHSLN